MKRESGEETKETGNESFYSRITIESCFKIIDSQLIAIL
jgi:hypothetical protein